MKLIVELSTFIELEADSIEEAKMFAGIEFDRHSYLEEYKTFISGVYPPEGVVVAQEHLVPIEDVLNAK
jgi:hypothetical protein